MMFRIELNDFLLASRSLSLRKLSSVGAGGIIASVGAGGIIASVMLGCPELAGEQKSPKSPWLDFNLLKPSGYFT
jgi:hypothetical protein